MWKDLYTDVNWRYNNFCKEIETTFATITKKVIVEGVGPFPSLAAPFVYKECLLAMKGILLSIPSLFFTCTRT